MIILDSHNFLNDKGIQFFIIVIIFLGGLYFGINFSSTNIDYFSSENPITSEIISNTNEPNTRDGNDNEFTSKIDILQTNYSYDELVSFALEKINEDRLSHGIAPVQLGNNQAAQNHANDMLQYDYFSHWNTNGVKPYVTYTKLGGNAYVQENIATSWCEGYGCIMEPKKLIEKAQYAMVYDDANSNWGHRDNILDPHHTHVNIGISFDNSDFYYAQHFENRFFEWIEFSLDDENNLKIKGETPPGFAINSITIFQDSLPVSINGEQIQSTHPYNQRFYDGGELIGILVEKPDLFGFYEECDNKKIEISLGDDVFCISYEMYDVITDEFIFEITANMSHWLKLDGIHTIYINLESLDGEFVPATSVTLEFI